MPGHAQWAAALSKGPKSVETLGEVEVRACAACAHTCMLARARTASGHPSLHEHAWPVGIPAGTVGVATVAYAAPQCNACPNM